MRLADEVEPRSIELRTLARAAGEDGLVDLAVEVTDGPRHWRLDGPLLTSGETADLAAWLAGIAEDTTGAPDDWSSVTFTDPALSASGRRIPGGTVELRVAVLRMRTDSDAVSDVVIGLRTTSQRVLEAARDLAGELSSLEA
ncbi:WapI family immunity protein [Leifsonia sp. AG29]|uniref:WapI family immunity protein n=1 Tax=Leifsonia sp. AG29 TaxID=2598860 RepID=UPI00131B1268|nr:hypothetical protein [Leifsonia sp. AG29]